ncbi:MAG: hypothetical protein PHY47_28555, partial [Lachnospiraceae bacterium]|nr:hypothetical protein [Lachnospiraceae bacterium]
STEGDLFGAEKREEKQLHYIRDYANSHNIIIRKKMHRDVMGQNIVNVHWDKMVDLIRRGVVDGIIVTNMEAVSSSIPDAFYKIGKVYEAGGVVVTVDEGRLSMPIRTLIDGRMVLVNAKS